MSANVFQAIHNIKIDKGQLYASLYDAYVKAYSQKRKQDCQKEVNDIWSKVKSEDNLSAKVDSLLREYDALFKKKKGTLMSFWANKSLRHDGAILM